MFRDILLTRSFIASLVFFLLIVCGSLLYYLHVRGTLQTSIAQTKHDIQTLHERNEARTAQDVSVLKETETFGVLETPIVLDDTNTLISEVTEALPNDELEALDTADAFLPEEMENENAEEPVSPHGFGPYPEVPSDYFRTPMWEYPGYQFAPDHELIERVLIKLWKQGIYCSGGGMENGRIYPILRGTVYVKWKDGFISDYTGHPDDDDEQIISMLEAGQTPAGITVLDRETAGIDPYQFLNLHQ